MSCLIVKEWTNQRAAVLIREKLTTVLVDVATRGVNLEGNVVMGDSLIVYWI